MITVLTGPAAAGKNTIGHLYATRHSKRCAVIDVDLVRWMLRQPHKAPWEGEEGHYQHQLGVRHSCLLAKSFVKEGCEVLITDVVNDELAAMYRKELSGYENRIMRLLPSCDESLRRLKERPPSITEAEARMLYDQQQALRDFDFSLDNSILSAEEVAMWLVRIG